MWTTRRRALTSLLVAMALAGCGGSSSVGPSPSVSFSGTWRGTFGTTDPSSVTWTATQSGTSVTGPVAVLVNLGQSARFNGTITGTVTNGQLALTLIVPAGAIAQVPACSMSAAGTTTTATAASIVATVVTTFSQACVGTITNQSQSTAQLILTRS